MFELIQNSRERSQKFGISESLTYSKKIINEDELNERLIKNEDLIKVAEPFMNQLYEFVKGSGFFAILTDADGCILSMIGDESILNKANALKMIPGAFMDEKNIGTNAMGLSLAEGCPIQVSGDEHSIRAYHGWTCSAACIYSEEGTLLGTLDLTGSIDHVHAHTLGMVVAAVNAIEKTMNLTTKTREINENAQFTETLLDSIQASIISCDQLGYIKTVNRQALKLFGTTEASLKRENIRNFFSRFDRILEVCQKGSEFETDEVLELEKGKKQYVNVMAYPVEGSAEKVDATILVIREIKKVHKMANEIMGRRAIYTFDQIIGQSAKLMDVITMGKDISDSKSTVLLTGESGTGKEIFAHAIHNNSNRKNKNFIVLNCASIPRSLIESELFGYEEGSFTGAKRGGHPGKFEVADGGTLFLDEIGEMPLDMQTRLLRVIQESMVSRVGSNSQLPIDVRIIAATNKDLYEEVTKGNFRLDLYYRLKVLPIHLPPLRERRDDIPMLVSYFNKKVSSSINKKMMEIPEYFMNHLKEYHWPGNVRELENVIELMLNTRSMPDMGKGKKNIIAQEFVADHSSIIKRDGEKMLTLDEVMKKHIEQVIKENNYNISHSAKCLGIGRNTLYRKIENYGIGI